MRFFRHDGIYRSDVSSPLFTPGRTRFPVGPVPGYRTRRKAHALPIVRDEFRPAIPRRVARQHCPPPLHRHHQIKTLAASNGILYHRTVASLLTVCLSPGDKPSNPRDFHLLPVKVIVRHNFIGQPLSRIGKRGTPFRAACGDVSLKRWFAVVVNPQFARDRRLSNKAGAFHGVIARLCRMRIFCFLARRAVYIGRAHGEGP